MFVDVAATSSFGIGSRSESSSSVVVSFSVGFFDVSMSSTFLSVTLSFLCDFFQDLM